MIKFNSFRLFRKRKLESSMHEYLILSEKDIEKLQNGQSISFEVEKFIPELIVTTEENYERMMSEVRRYKYD